jgi:hypothetical protein
MIFDIESKKAVIVSNLSKNLWLVALILFSLFAIILLKVPAIGTAQVENLSDNSTLINETLVLPDIVNDTVNETQIINETIVDNNYTDEFVNNTSPDAVLINDTELPIDKNKFLVSIQGNTSANLTSNMDTAVRSFTPDTNYGTDTFVRVQTFSTANTRTFISFNLSSIPANATILSANLSLHRYSSGTITRTYNIHRVNASWSETVITWNNQVSVDGLTTSASVGVVDTWYTWDVISDVRGFMNGSYPNYGWRISDSAESSGTAYTSDFYSREYAVDTTLRPRLTVYYSIDTPPTTALVSPSNGNITTSNSVNFTCSATDDYKLTNITFYWNYAGSFIANETVNVSGTNNQTTFARNNLDKGDILWNCLACDNASQCSFASANWTVTIASMPLISFTNPTPANGAITSNISIIANISITNTSDLTQFIWNWNGTNYTFYSNSLMLLMNLDNVSVLGENATKAVDASRNGKNGTILGGAVYTSSGKYGGAYTFDGINDYINFSGRATSVTDNWALSAWIKPALLPQFSFAVYNGNDAGGYGFGISNGAGLSGSVLTGLYGAVAYINSGYTFASANTWYHVVMVRASGTTYFYVNGIQVSTSAPLPPNAPNDRLTIGNQMDPSNNPTRYFNGTIDEVRIYNRSLSADEVKQFYYSNFNKYNTDKWQFYTNETNLTSQGSYTYGGCANNTVGGNCTETRIIYMGDWTPPGISFTNPTPANGTITADTFAIINISITNASDLNEFKWKWNGTNYTFYNSSLVLMLNLDNISALGESSTKAVDVSPSSNNATFTNAPTWTTSGKYGGALNFAGTTYATTTITGFSASTGIVLMWIKPNKDLRTVTQAFFDTKPGVAGALRIYSFNDNSLHYETGGAASLLTWTIPSNWTGQWHQIGLNWSGSATALIVDGAVVASGSNTQAPSISTFEIGRYNSGSNFNGTIDEVRVYSTGLSPGELKQQYYSNLNKYDTDKWAFTTNQSNLTAGTYTYQSFVKDTNSNANQTDLNYLYIDLTAPTTALVSPSNGNITTSNSVNFTCSATDDFMLKNITFYWNYTGSFIANGTINVSGISNQTSFNRTNLNNGAILWNCLACDNASQCSFASANYTVRINVTDTIAPNVNITYPQNTTYNLNVSALNYTYSDANPGYCWYSRDNGVTNSTTVTAGINFTSVTSVEGSNMWTLYCNDSFGNRNSSQVTFSKDTGKPLWSNPTINETNVYNGMNVKFNATWTNAQLAGYKFAINQTGNWVNSSYITFTGIQNVSENISLISANAGTNVTWFFWANDSAGNANQTSLQSFVVQTGNTSLAFSINQTLYPQAKSPGGGYDIYIPFQTRYLDNNGQPVSGATCQVTNDETSDIVSLTFNATTGNYTGQVTDYMMYDVVTFNATCSRTSYNTSSNSTTTNVWWFNYLWEWENRSYGAFNNYTSTWLRKEPTQGVNIYNFTEILNTSIGENELDKKFFFYGSGTNGSFLKDYNMLGLHTLRLNISINNSACQPYLCMHIYNFNLNVLTEHCGSPVAIPANTPTLIEQNVTENCTISQNNYLVMHAHLNCSSAVSEKVMFYYNYTGQPANIEVKHAEPTQILSSIAAWTQIENNYTIGPNQSINITRKWWIIFNNTKSNPQYTQYWFIPQILVDYPDRNINNTIYVYNSTGGLLASDNVSAGAPNVATSHSDNRVDWHTEIIPNNTAVNETLQRGVLNAIRDNETLLINTTQQKQWQASVWSVFISQVTIYNVTARTNYSTYEVPDNFGFKVNVTNSSGTFDISSQISLNTTTKIITMPMTSLSQVVYTVTASDITPPTVHLNSPANRTLTNQASLVFSCNISDVEIASLALNIWNSTGDLINTNTTNLSGTFNQTNWTYSLLYDDSWKWNCLGYDTNGNFNWSSEGNYTITLDTMPPYFTNLADQTLLYGQSLSYTINANDSGSGVNCFSINNTGTFSINCSGFLKNVTSLSLGIYWLNVSVNDSAGNLNSSLFFVNVTSADVVPPVITSTLISPYDPAIDYNVTLNATATDNLNVSGTFVNITLPNSTVITRTLPMANYTIQTAGRHNVTFWANDTGGNIGTSADYFIAGISRVPVQFNIINNNSEGLPVNLTIYFTGTDKEVYEHDFTGIYLDMHTTLLYDLNYRALDGNLSVRLNEVNLSLDNNRTIGLDRFTTLSGYLVTYGINNTYSFTNALITMSYLGTGYTNESYLGLYRCSSWDFAARTCSGTWDAVSGTQDETAKTFTLTTTGFSAYSIKQEAVPSPPSPSGPSEGGPSAGAEWWLSNRRINISITGNCTGKDVIIKVTNPILNESNASIPGVQINILSNSTNLTTTTDINGIAIFRPVSPGVYTLLFSKQHYAGSQINYSIFSCPVAAPEKEKPVVLIEYKPEIYKETKSPILTTVALILAGLLVLFIVLKIAVMRRREREFHHKFNVRHAHVHNGRLIIHRHS